MVDVIKAINELIGRVSGVSDTGVAVLALVVALSAIWVYAVRRP